MKGKRKFILSLIALVIFGAALVLRPEINPEQLGFGLSAILFGFGVPNMAEHIKGFGGKK